MRVSDECECLMMTACVRGQKSRGVFAFSFSRLRRTTAKLVRGIAPFERTAPVWNGHEVNATRRKRVRIARSRPRAWGGIERRSPRCAVRRERDLRFRDRRASLFRDADVVFDTHRSRRTRRTTVARREWASHRTGRTSGTARGLASTARTSEAVRTEGRVHEESRAEHFAPTNRARASQCLGGARGSAETSAPRHTHLSSDSVRASGNDRERTPRNVEPYLYGQTV